jgi:hypothetical protein
MEQWSIGNWTTQSGDIVPLRSNAPLLHFLLPAAENSKLKEDAEIISKMLKRLADLNS